MGEDFFLCFSPERVDPANQVWKTRNTPKVIGGLTESCLEAGLAAYERFIEEMVAVSSPETAEMVKLLENTFRAVNIALVNEIAQIADRLQVDIWEVVEAAATKPFGFMKFTPGPGFGGHCIPIDPHYLSWKMHTLDYQARFIELASEINAEMPRFVVGKVRKALNAKHKPVNGSRVLVLGVAYKKDVDDPRESPAFHLMDLLRARGAVLSYNDPHIPQLPQMRHHDVPDLASAELIPEFLADQDCVLIATDHSAYDYDFIVKHSQLVLDTRNATKHVTTGREKIRKA